MSGRTVRGKKLRHAKQQERNSWRKKKLGKEMYVHMNMDHGSYSSKATHGMVSGDPPVTTSISPRHPRQGDAIHMLASQENKNNIRNIEGRLNFPRLFQPVTLSR